MGSVNYYPEEAPVRTVRVDPFSIDPHPVTNQEYSRFVDETGYMTVAERPLDPSQYPGAHADILVPGSLVFTGTNGPVSFRGPPIWWSYVAWAQWHHPLGPESDITALGDHPVVQIAYEDAEAYAAWEGSSLPTEAEWEYAARGGLVGAEFAWGEMDQQDSQPLANTWHGSFPWNNTLLDGWLRTSPVGSFPPNGFGLYDMTGNVWEWTKDFYSDTFVKTNAGSCCIAENPRGPKPEESFDPNEPAIRIPRKVLKGGSHLCASNYCLRYRPAARIPQMVDTATNHIGFRVVRRETGLAVNPH